MWVEFHEHLASLPEDERLLWDALYYQGLKQPETADLLGIPLRTLQRRWPEMKIRTRTALGDDWPLQD